MSKHIQRPVRFIKRVIKRILHTRKRTRLILGVTLFINVALILQLYANLFAYPNTYVGNVNISGKTKTDIRTLLASWQKLPYRMQIKERVYTYSLTDLGGLIDTDKTINELFHPNTLPFPFNAASLITSLVQPREIAPTLTFTQQFAQFIHDTIFDFNEGSIDQLLVDVSDKTITYLENEEKYRIDEDHLKSLLANRIGNATNPLYPKLIKIQNENVIGAITNAEKLRNMFAEPLPVYIDASGNIKQFYLTDNELRGSITVSVRANQVLDIRVASHPFRTVIDAHAKKLGFMAKSSLATPKVEEDFLRVIEDRANGTDTYALRIGLDDGPNTTGDAAQKYIEVDISQQRMYLFKERKLVKSYRVSTGLEYPTPTGRFEILNKVGLGFSNIYEVWMPYWMGFSYSDELNAYFGIHELPYKLIDGNIKMRPITNIGTPNTGGCVALSPGEAVQVYRFADVGTPIYIYD